MDDKTSDLITRIIGYVCVFIGGLLLIPSFDFFYIIRILIGICLIWFGFNVEKVVSQNEAEY